MSRSEGGVHLPPGLSSPVAPDVNRRLVALERTIPDLWESIRAILTVCNELSEAGQALEERMAALEDRVARLDGEVASVPRGG